MYRLENTIQRYTWGSVTAIPELLGIPNPGAEPMAELWMGAHPKAPSAVSGDVPLPLDELIARDPEGILGRGSCRQFGPMLPFLFKVLAAGSPLSIQAHPDKRMAAEGFARENVSGIPLSAPERNYRDDNHKPEIICALSDFIAMKGFRPPEEIENELSVLGSGLSGTLTDVLKKKGLEELFRRIVELGAEEVAQIVLSASGLPGETGRWVRRLADSYPGDAGVLCPLLLNIVRLSPGRALYLDAGELHAYLSGTGIELMANSDNVLRGGLTSKHVDVAELMRVLSFTHRPPSVLSPVPGANCEEVYPTPSGEFRLSKITVHEGSEFRSAAERNVEILLCVEGSVSAELSGGDTVEVRRGESVLVPASDPRYGVRGRGVLFKATVPVSG